MPKDILPSINPAHATNVFMSVEIQKQFAFQHPAGKITVFYYHV